MLAIYFLWKDNRERRWNQNLQNISGCKFMIKLKMLKFVFFWQDRASHSLLLTIQSPAVKACKLIFCCENNKNVLRGILTDLWLIPALTHRMIGWLEKHSDGNSELLSNYFRLSATFCTFPRYNQQIISNVLQGKKHVRALNHSLNTQLTRNFLRENLKEF